MPCSISIRRKRPKSLKKSSQSHCLAFDDFGTLANQSAPKKIRPWDFGSQGVKKMSNASEASKTVKNHKKNSQRKLPSMPQVAENAQNLRKKQSRGAV